MGLSGCAARLAIENRARVVTPNARGAAFRVAPLPHRPRFRCALHRSRPTGSGGCSDRRASKDVTDDTQDAAGRHHARCHARRHHGHRFAGAGGCTRTTIGVCPRACTRTRSGRSRGLGLAASRLARHPSSVYCAVDRVLGRSSRHRHRGRSESERARSARPGRRSGALRRSGCRPRRAVGRTQGWGALELRAGHRGGAQGRCRPPRPGDRNARRWPLLDTVPALRGPGRWAVRLAAAVSRWRRAAGAAAITARRSGVTLGDALARNSPSAAPPTRVCTAGWCRDSRGRAVPARSEGLPRRRADALPRCA